MDFFLGGLLQIGLGLQVFLLVFLSCIDFYRGNFIQIPLRGGSGVTILHMSMGKLSFLSGELLETHVR